MAKDLQGFIKKVKSLAPEEVVVVKKELDPIFEISAAAACYEKAGQYPMLVAEDVKGSKMPVVVNVFATYRKLALAFDIDLKENLDRDLLQRYLAREMNPILPKLVSDGPVKEVVMKGAEVDLFQLPIVQHNELDSGRYISGGCMVCRDPDSRVINVGIYRHELKGKATLGVMINPVRHAKEIWRRHQERSKTMDVAIVVGQHPAAVIGALYRGPLEMSEYNIMGGLLGEPLEVVPAETIDLEVPAQAEIVIEGIIKPGNNGQDGPFGEYLHYYGGVRECYLIDVQAVTMRSKPIYHDLFAGHMEHGALGPAALPREAIVWRAIKDCCPTLKAVRASQGNCIISIKKRVEGEGKRVAFAALSCDEGVKNVIVVDEDIDIYNDKDIFWAMATRTQADTDVSIISHCSGNHLDPTSYDETRIGEGAMSTKLIIDATKPVDREFPAKVAVPQKIVEKISAYLKT